MSGAEQMADEIYGLHCDIGRLENLVKHWKTEFINEQEYARMMESESEKVIWYLRQENIDWENKYRELSKKNVKLQEMIKDVMSCIEFRIALDKPLTTEMYERFAEQARELGVIDR